MIPTHTQQIGLLIALAGLVVVALVRVITHS